MVKKATIETLAVQMEKCDKRLDTFATLMVEGFENLNGKVDALTQEVAEVKDEVFNDKDTLEAHGKAIDKDAVTLINHEGRIKKLEVVR